MPKSPQSKTGLLLFTLIIDLLLFRFGVILGTLADESQTYNTQFDTVFLLVVFFLTLLLQIKLLRAKHPQP